MAQKAIARQQARTIRSASDRRMGLGLLASIDDNANRAQKVIWIVKMHRQDYKMKGN